MIADLQTLRRAGFTGIVTYGSLGIQGTAFPGLAKQEGFDTVIMGIWDPTNQTEITNAQTAAAQIPVVRGFCVGNEGVGGRYSMAQLQSAISTLKSTTGKPCSTTEVIEKYTDPTLMPTLVNITDWVYPNAHPYWHNVTVPTQAVQWTQNAYNQFLGIAGSKPLILKEVGEPTAGDTRVSPTVQEQYYLGLANTNVKFNYFEAFDGAWKTWASVEPYWGLFTSTRAAKPIATDLLNQFQPNMNFYVYQDATSANNHYAPSGYMGDMGDIKVDPASTTSPHSGNTCVHVTYSAKGAGPYSNGGSTAMGWGGMYWLDPANNWGTNANLPYSGYDLSNYNTATFWARADSPCKVTFTVGGVSGTAGDSLTTGLTTTVSLTTSWQQYSIPLSGNLSHIIGGFAWSATAGNNPFGASFYLDDIQFVRK
jgi:exo-beta-1,3-glucanase (GH17 family)